MRYMRNNPGFTLVEVLVISPIVILFIGMFIALLVTLTGESLIVRERNVAVHDTQAALDDIQSDISQATNFLTTTGPLQTPQGKNDANAAFTSTNVDGGGNPLPDSLIIKKAATTKNPADPSRKLIYLGAGDCDAKNPPLTYTVIYFVDLDTDTANETDKALYKRTILPSASACATPWQRGTCKRDQLSTYPTLCQTYDERLVGGIETLTVSYFANGTSLSGPTGANDASIAIGVSKQVAGSSINYSSSIRTASPNIDASSAQSSSNNASSNGDGTSGSIPAPVSNPAIQWSRANNGPNPYRTTITWSRVGNAPGGYTAKYRIGGGAEQPVTITQPAEGATPTFSIESSHRKQTVQLTELKVITTSGSVNYGALPTISDIPNWNDAQFSGQGAWDDYVDYYPGGPYTRAGFTRTSSGIVGLKGLVKGTTLNVPIFTLPAGFRPKFPNEKLIFQVATGNGANWGRIDIHPNGDVIPVQGNTEWFSLDGIMFMSDSSNTTWSTLAWQNGWANYNSLYGGNAHATLRTTLDSQGRRHVQGLGGYSGTSPNVPMTAPGGAPNRTLHYPAMSGGPGIVQPASGGSILSRSSPNSYQSLQLIYRLAGATGWQNMPFSSGWTNYDTNNWPTMQCHRGSDDVVIIQGLIAHPGGGNGTYIGDTSPCGRLSSGKGIGVEDRMIFSPWLSNETTGRIDFINGVSMLSQGTQDPWTALDGIHFIAD